MAHDSPSVSSCAQAVGLGFVAGIRSQLPLALLALAARRGQFAAGSEPSLHLLRSPAAQRVLAVWAVGEFVGDKLPITPSRLSAGPLLGRMLFGGLAGAAITTAARRSPLLGAALGAAGAVLGARAGYQARAVLGRVSDVPDPVWGGVEDVVAVTLGWGVLGLSRSTGEN